MTSEALHVFLYVFFDVYEGGKTICMTVGIMDNYLA